MTGEGLGEKMLERFWKRNGPLELLGFISAALSADSAFDGPAASMAGPKLVSSVWLSRLRLASEIGMELEICPSASGDIPLSVDAAGLKGFPDAV